MDARTGVITQTRRHTYLVSLLGIKHVVLAVNKMDLVDFDKQIFDKIVADYKAFVKSLNIPDITYIPLSALDGDNVVDKSDRTPWYEGPSLLDFLETVPIDRIVISKISVIRYNMYCVRTWTSVASAVRSPAVSSVKEIR